MNNTSLLVIEDDPRIADMICHLAMDAGFTAHAAMGPAEITKAYENAQPDVIVLDLHMPDMDGIEVLQFLHQQFCRARIIIMSGSDGSSRRMTESLGKGLGLTIEANLSKPFDIAEFRAILEGIHKSLDDSRKLSEQAHGNRH